MSRSPWRPYCPSQGAFGTCPGPGRLRRRAGVAATWVQLRCDLADGHEAAVNLFLEGTCRTEGVPAEFGPTAGLLGDAGASDVPRLPAGWLYRGTVFYARSARGRIRHARGAVAGPVAVTGDR